VTTVSDNNNDHETRIRDRAYAIWQEEGQPEGQEHAHWQRARDELGSGDTLSQGGEKAENIVGDNTSVLGEGDEPSQLHEDVSGSPQAGELGRPKKTR
jgi:hypothetical protein